MNWPLLRRLLGIIALLLGVAMLFSLPWAFPWAGRVQAVETNGLRGLLSGIGVSWALGTVLFWSGRGASGPIYRREALAVVALGWLLAACLGAVPFYVSGTHRSTRVQMSLADAFFESMSGFTTTGASVLSDLEMRSGGRPPLVPRCILFWRCFTHFLGGMGIVVLFVALLGHLGGAKLLFRGEVSGMARETLQPRIRHTARILWTIWVVLNVAAAAALWLQGMDLYDALCHSFGALATGGFSTRNASIGAYSPTIQLTTVLLMIVGGTNFTLFYLLWQRQTKLVLRNRELRAYLTFLLVTVALVFFVLANSETDAPSAPSLRDIVFNTLSIATTTGYATYDFDEWPAGAKAVLLASMFVGGSVGSTTGGVKILRALLLMLVLRQEVLRVFRPHVVRPIRIGGEPVHAEVRHDVVVFVSVVAMVFVVASVLLALSQPESLWQSETLARPADPLVDSASAVAACMNSVGPGFGLVGPVQNYGTLNAFGKLLLAMVMLLGRLEYFTLLVLFSKSFWKAQ